MLKILLLAVLQLMVVVGDRSFIIDYDNNQFLKDGQPYQYISGSLHYFRVPRIYWQDRLNKFKATGLNNVQTYVDWSQHEPIHGQYNFEDNLDIVEFLTLANQTGFTVTLRPGPYICAEREFGGLPFWLLQEDPNMVIRSSDPTYLAFVDSWFAVLLAKIEPLLYKNGGPVIMNQVENEYGFYSTCDSVYTEHVRDTMRSILGQDAVLYTTDGAGDGDLQCGKIQDVYATVDFGPGSDVDACFQAQRDFEPNGPLVNSEFYTGWLDHWGEPHSQANIPGINQTLTDMLKRNASVNMYMFLGGTNFGFSAGSDVGDTLEPCPTSYDYDAPLTEAGDPTNQLNIIRDIIMQHTGVDPGPVPPATTKVAYGDVTLVNEGTVFDLLDDLLPSPPVSNDNPLTFEALGQAYGFVLYETVLQKDYSSSLLSVTDGVHDLGYVFLDQVPVGRLSRMDYITSLNINATANQVLGILIENQGRVCFGSMTEFKGIPSTVTLDGVELHGWTMSSIPLTAPPAFQTGSGTVNSATQVRDVPPHVPSFYYGTFTLADGEEPQDTFMDPTGWTKGVAYLNGFNLGRYWPVRGPQITLYVPKSALVAFPDTNKLTLFEQEGEADDLTVTFVDTATVNAPVSRKQRKSTKSYFKK